MAKEKKTIIFIVEGSSDKAALENIFKKIYRRNKEIDFGFTNGDITSDPIDYKRFVGQYSLMKPTEKGCVKPHKNV